MSSLKTDAKQNKRGMLNTTIEIETFNNFRIACKQTGVPMNMILETFMKQFVNGEFQLKFTKSNNLEFDLNE